MQRRLRVATTPCQAVPGDHAGRPGRTSTRGGRPGRHRCTRQPPSRRTGTRGGGPGRRATAGRTWAPPPVDERHRATRCDRRARHRSDGRGPGRLTRSTDAVLDIVAGLTGYPRDLLDLDLDLEADLGVDTVKQAEVFAAVRERFAIPRHDNLKLRDFPTLTHVIGFVHDNTQQPPKAAAAARASRSPRPCRGPGSCPAAAQAADPAAAQAADPITEAVLDIVAGLTGYPRDLLDLDLDLEADLGVDTVKQAEVFAAVRERFAIPRQDNLKLRDFPTLTHVIGFVRDHAVPAQPVPATPRPPSPWRATRRPSQPAAPETEAAPRRSARRPPSPVTRRRRERLPRRIPAVVLRPPAQWCKPTAVTLGQESRVIVLADEGGVAKALVKRLGSLGVSALVIEPGCPADDLDSRLAGWLAEGPSQGLYWLAALDAEPALSELDLDGWHEALRRRVKNLYAVVRRLDQAGQLGPRGHVPGDRDPDGRLPRIRQPRSDGSARRRGDRPRQGVLARAAGRPGQGGRLPGQQEDRRARRRADRGDPARSRSGRDRPRRRPPLDGGPTGSPVRRRQRRNDARQRDGVRGDRSGRGDRLGHRRGPGQGQRRHLPPHRPDTRAGSGRPGPDPVRHRPGRAEEDDRRAVSPPEVPGRHRC